MGHSIDIEFQVIPQVLKVVLGDATFRVEMPCELIRADGPFGFNALSLEHIEIELSVVGHQDALFIVQQGFQFFIGMAAFERRLGCYHLVVM